MKILPDNHNRATLFSLDSAFVSKSCTPHITAAKLFAFVKTIPSFKRVTGVKNKFAIAVVNQQQVIAYGGHIAKGAKAWVCGIAVWCKCIGEVNIAAIAAGRFGNLYRC